MHERVIEVSENKVCSLHTFAPVSFALHLSSLRLIIRLRTPMRMSVLILLSCASSIMITEYLFKRKSFASSRRSTPSVMNLIEVCGETVASYRIWYDTLEEVSESSWATREAMDMAATRRGWVTPIMPGLSAGLSQC